MEGVPGVAKTLLVRSLAAALSVDTKRVQFTPDLMPGDITGSLVYDNRGRGAARSGEGPLFTNLLLADEINRTPPKTQSALLEAMEERQVSVDGHARPLPQPFLVAATQNPVEYEGTYPLPEAQLDRFLLKVVVPLPERDARARRSCSGTPTASTRTTSPPPGSRAVAGPADVRRGRGSRAHGRRCRPRSSGYVVDIARATRVSPSLEPRGQPARRDRAAAHQPAPGRGCRAATS